MCGSVVSSAHMSVCCGGIYVCYSYLGGSPVLPHLLLVTHHWEYCLNRSNLVSAIR